MKLFDYVWDDLKGTVYYGDTDSIVTDCRIPDFMLGSEFGKLKFEGTYNSILG